MTISTNELGSQLRERRKFLGLTQAALAERAGVSIPTVRSLEAGAGQIGSLEKTIAALGLVWGFTKVASDEPGATLVQLRKHAKLSQRKMARRIGVTQPTIIALEHRFAGSVQALTRYLGAARSRQVLRDPSKPRRPAAPKRNDATSDIVMTPRSLARRVIGVFAPEIDGIVLEPARGEGAFYDAFPAHLDKDWCELGMGRDFFGYRRRVDWIISNPPYSKFRGFLIHGMELADHLVYVSHLPHFTTRARLRDIAQAGFGFRRILTLPQPRDWPSSGFQLAAVHLERGWKGPCDFRRLGHSLEAEVDDDDLEMIELELIAAEKWC